VFVEIRADTLNIDETKIEAAITPRTKAIVPVHYAGVGCDMDAILDIARRHDLLVIEDAAQAIVARYRDRPLGGLGHLAALSFHETKNIISGEGGALLINDPRFVERAEIVWEKGTNRSQFFRGQVDKYTWVDLGSSYVLSDLLGALLVAQLEVRDEIQRRRARIWHRYAAELAGWAAARGYRTPIVPEHCAQSFHMFYLLLPAQARTAFIEHLKARGISAVFHYQSLHLSPMGLRYGGRPGLCPVTERVADELVRLPLYNDMTDAEQSQVIDAVVSL
jgi:dTDP-4-amino-4,6-dideoxygalactose transaminase